MFSDKIHQYTRKKLIHLYVRKSNLKGKIRPPPSVRHGAAIGVAVEMRIHQRFWTNLTSPPVKMIMPITYIMSTRFQSPVAVVVAREALLHIS